MKKKKHIEAFMFIDALGWKIVSDSGFLEKELPFRFPVQMQFGYSSTAVPTILSGRRPDEHGHFSFFYYSPETSPFRIFRALPFGENRFLPWNRGRGRSWISKIFKFLKHYTGYFQLYRMPFRRLQYFDYCEKQDIFAKDGLAPYKNLRDILEDSGLTYHISDWRLPERENIEFAEKLMRKASTDFYFIYTAAFDALLHFNVGRREPVEKHLAFYTEEIRKMLALLGETAETFSFTVISDHGMTPLEKTCDIRGTVEKLGLVFGSDYAACYDSTMFRVWFLSDGSREKIMDAVNAGTFPGRYLSDEEKKRYGLAFRNCKYGDEIFLLDPGCQIVPSDMAAKPLPGMHGFLPEDRHSTAAFLSSAPVSGAPLEVADFFRIMKERIERLADENGTRKPPILIKPLF